VARLGIKRRRPHLSRRREIALFALSASVIAIPTLAAVWAVIVTTEPDLSNLIPINEKSGDDLLLPWPALAQENMLGLTKESMKFVGTRVRALGYMMEIDQPVHNGSLVSQFALLPEPGTLRAPAHRFEDQMILVRLRDQPQPFSARRLVWVWGALRAFSDGRFLYRLDQARVQPAERREIWDYFR